jgi:hypothetical protein
MVVLEQSLFAALTADMALCVVGVKERSHHHLNPVAPSYIVLDKCFFSGCWLAVVRALSGMAHCSIMNLAAPSYIVLDKCCF